RANTQRPISPGKHNGIRFDVLDHAPAESDRAQLPLSRLAARHDRKSLSIRSLRIRFLQQKQTAPNAPHFPGLSVRGLLLDLQQPKIFLFLQNFERLRGKVRRDDYLAENFCDSLCARPIERLVYPNNSAKGRL